MTIVFSLGVFSSCLLQKRIKKEDSLECEDCVKIMCKDNKVSTKYPNTDLTHDSFYLFMYSWGQWSLGQGEDSFVGIGN